MPSPLSNTPALSSLQPLLSSRLNRYEAALEELENGITAAQRVRLFADRMQGGVMSDNIEKQKSDVRLRLRVLNELNVHERRMPKLLDRKAREAVAQKLQLQRSAVDDVVFQFQLQRAQWTFLRRERLRNRPVPVSSEELEWRLKLKPTREFIEAMDVFRKRKQMLEEERPGYVPTPRRMHFRTKRNPLRIRPYISSSNANPERRKAPPKPYKRHRGSTLLS